MRGSVVQYQLLSAKQGSRNLVVMNIHRAKGKEFDEVFVDEELHTPFVRQGETDLSATHARSSGGNVGASLRSASSFLRRRCVFVFRQICQVSAMTISRPPAT